MKKYGIMDILTGLLSANNPTGQGGSPLPGLPAVPPAPAQGFAGKDGQKDARTDAERATAYRRYVLRHEALSRNIDSARAANKTAESGEAAARRIEQLSRELELEREKLRLRERQLEIIERELAAGKKCGENCACAEEKSELKPDEQKNDEKEPGNDAAEYVETMPDEQNDEKGSNNYASENIEIKPDEHTAE